MTARDQTQPSQFRKFPYWAGGVAILLGSLTLTGWVLGISILRTAFPGLVSMKANTAVCLILAGGSLVLQASPVNVFRVRLGRVLAGIVTAAALLTLIEYALRVDFGVDRILFQESTRQAGGSFPGRMSLATGLEFFLLGAALLSLDWRLRSGGRFTAQVLVLAAGVVSLLAFIGYFYGVEKLLHLEPYSTIAFNTVIASWLLCVGILFARPQTGIVTVFTSDKLGGLLARRMLPAAVLVPLLCGWLHVLGQRSGIFGLSFGSALYATLLIVTFTGLVAWAASALNRADAERRQGAEALRQSNARLQAVREEERTRVAREIHDVLAQELTRLKLDISWSKRQLAAPVDSGKQEKLVAKLAGMSEVTDTAISSVQRIATQLRPVVLDSLGLCAAIEWQAKDFEARTGIESRATVPEADLPVQRDHSTALFRILQESLTNVARHAQATRVDIELQSQTDGLSLRVCDNGRGITPAELDNPQSVGLVGMRERATLLGGACQISRRPEGGTLVEAHLPYDSSASSPP